MLLSNFAPRAALKLGLKAFGPPNPKLGWAVFETLVFTLALILVGYRLSPADPLFIEGSVPWSWAAPVLLALRYGMLSGLSSMVLLLAAWQLLTTAGTAPPTQYFVGGLLLTMICGEFSGLWRSRVRRLAEANSYLEDRVERVTGRLYMVQRSHDQLQQELLQRPTTLRHALEGLQRRALAGQPTAAVAAQAFLDHLASSCQLEDAQIVALEPLQHAPGTLLAHVGRAETLSMDDALVRFALETGRLAHLQIGLPTDSAPTRHLIATPLVIGQQRQAALLVVSRMPFLALHDETLQMISVLCSAFSSVADVGEEVAALLAEVPGCPVRLGEELCRLDRIARQFRLPSHLVLLRFDDPARAVEQSSMAERRARSPDVTWAYTASGGRRRLLTLMPLAGREAVEGYLASITALIGSRYESEAGRVGLSGLRIGTEVLDLGSAPLGEGLRQFIAERSP